MKSKPKAKINHDGIQQTKKTKNKIKFDNYQQQQPNTATVQGAKQHLNNDKQGQDLKEGYKDNSVTIIKINKLKDDEKIAENKVDLKKNQVTYTSWRENILLILEKWNKDKYNQLGFYWKIAELDESLRDGYDDYIDYIELRYSPSVSNVKIEDLPKVKKRKYPF